MVWSFVFIFFQIYLVNTEKIFCRTVFQVGMDQKNARRLSYIWWEFLADVEYSCVLSSLPCFFTFFRSIPTWKKFCRNFYFRNFCSFWGSLCCSPMIMMSHCRQTRLSLMTTLHSTSATHTQLSTSDFQTQLTSSWLLLMSNHLWKQAISCSQTQIQVCYHITDTHKLHVHVHVRSSVLCWTKHFQVEQLNKKLIIELCFHTVPIELIAAFNTGT